MVDTMPFVHYWFTLLMSGSCAETRLPIVTFMVRHTNGSYFLLTLLMFGSCAETRLRAILREDFSNHPSEKWRQGTLIHTHMHVVECSRLLACFCACVGSCLCSCVRIAGDYQHERGCQGRVNMRRECRHAKSHEQNCLWAFSWVNLNKKERCWFQSESAWSRRLFQSRQSGNPEWIWSREKDTAQ